MLDGRRVGRILAGCAAAVWVCLGAAVCSSAFATEPMPGDDPPQVVDRQGIRGKVMAGYQGWFRCAGDASKEGWAHWSRDGRRLTPQTLTFEMWPDMSETTPEERFPAPGFTYPDGTPAALFSSLHPKTVLRHFEWQRSYGIDGVWLQHFVVDLPGGPAEGRYASRMEVLKQVVESAEKTGRVWALTYDCTGVAPDRLYEILTNDWKKQVDAGLTSGPRYLHEKDRPVVQIWGFYRDNGGNKIPLELGRKLIAFFKTPGKYSAYVFGGGDWNWRKDPEYKELILSLDAYAPWNVGNYSKDAAGSHATSGYWAEDKAECDRRGVLWLPVVYPGFSWDNLRRKPPGSTILPRRGGKFFWEQFHAASKIGAEGAYVAMFDEVDEATAIFKVTNAPPKEAHFVGLEGLPSDWYLRLAGEAARRFRAKEAIPSEIPIRP